MTEFEIHLLVALGFGFGSVFNLIAYYILFKTK